LKRQGAEDARRRTRGSKNPLPLLASSAPWRFNLLKGATTRTSCRARARACESCA
jgi:hypothetical protein